MVRRADDLDEGPIWRLISRTSLRNIRHPGLLGQGMRFAITGCVVSVVYLTSTTVLSVLVRLPFQLALGIGYCLAITVHFTLQRTFVWAHQDEFALSLQHQLRRYLIVALTQYGLTAASTAVFPSLLKLPTELVYLVTAVLLTAANFLVFRNGIFHAQPVGGELLPTVEEPVFSERAGGCHRH